MMIIIMFMKILKMIMIIMMMVPMIMDRKYLQKMEVIMIMIRTW